MQREGLAITAVLFLSPPAHECCCFIPQSILFPHTEYHPAFTGPCFFMDCEQSLPGGNGEEKVQQQEMAP